MFVNRHQKAAAECGGFHLYKQYFLIQLKSAMQYKTSFFSYLHRSVPCLLQCIYRDILYVSAFSHG